MKGYNNSFNSWIDEKDLEWNSLECNFIESNSIDCDSIV